MHVHGLWGKKEDLYWGMHGLWGKKGLMGQALSNIATHIPAFPFDIVTYGNLTVASCKLI